VLPTTDHAGKYTPVTNRGDTCDASTRSFITDLQTVGGKGDNYRVSSPWLDPTDSSGRACPYSTYVSNAAALWRLSTTRTVGGRARPTLPVRPLLHRMGQRRTDRFESRELATVESLRGDW